jgi:hypothetical protein
LGRGARLSGDKAGALEIVKCIKLDIKKGRPTAAEILMTYILQRIQKL